MYSNSTIQVRMPLSKKKKVEEILKKEGFSFSHVVNILFSDIIKKGTLPFDISYEPNSDTCIAIQEGRENKNIEQYDTVEDMFTALDI
jgi:addiction module RelB/DinJ family antitoxin